SPMVVVGVRNLLDAKCARGPYPGDQFVLPFGKARVLQEGADLTIVTWGAMCEGCEEAADQLDAEADILDLRTLMPWDKQAVLESVRKTNRCLIVHEDTQTAGFGAEISAVLARDAFAYLDAPVERLTMPDIPVPYNVELMKAVLPDANKISAKIEELLTF